MKKIWLSGASVLMLLATSCDKSGDSVADSASVVSSQEEHSGDIKTFDDSVAYFMGQDAALTFWQIAKNDTLFAKANSSEDFRKGVEAGIKTMQNSDAYILGMHRGMEMAANIKGLNKAVGMTLSDKALMKGFELGMESENAIDAIKFQADMSEVEVKLNTIIMEAQNAATDSVAKK